MDFDLELLGEIKEATAAGALNYTNVGETWIDNVKRVSWDNSTKKFVKVDYDGTPLADGERIEFQLHQSVEKKDGTSFTKTWYIDMRLSGKGARANKMTWGDITLPSVEKVFGSKGKFFKAMNSHPICAIEDFITGKVRKYNDRNTGEEKEADVTAPKFVATFKNEKAAKEWADGFYKKSDDNGQPPAEIIGQVKALLKTAKGNKEQVKEMLEDDDEFNTYDADELIALAEG